MASLAALFTASTAGENIKVKEHCVYSVFHHGDQNSSIYGPVPVPYCLPFLVRQSHELASICEAYIILFCTCKFCRYYKQVHSLQLLLLNCARVWVYSWTAPSGEIWQAVTSSLVFTLLWHMSVLSSTISRALSPYCVVLVWLTALMHWQPCTVVSCFWRRAFDTTRLRSSKYAGCTSLV